MRQSLYTPGASNTASTWPLSLFSPSSMVSRLCCKFLPKHDVPIYTLTLTYVRNRRIFTAFGTLVVDCYPQLSSSATAANNLARCLMGAAGTACIKPLVKAINVGPAFTLLFGLEMLASVAAVVHWRYGMQWRQQRARRLAAAAEKTDRKEAGKK